VGGLRSLPGKQLSHSTAAQPGAPGTGGIAGCAGVGGRCNTMGVARSLTWGSGFGPFGV